MDGTIYLSEQLFDGTIDFLNYVKRIGGRYLFLTNNSSRGTDAYIAKMKRLGIEAFPEDFLTSADAAVDYFRQNPSEGNIYVCGTESLKGQLRAAGLPVAASADDRVSTVLLGYDTELTYQKLEDCCIQFLIGQLCVIADLSKIGGLLHPARARRGLHCDASGHGLPDMVRQCARLRQLH